MHVRGQLRDAVVTILAADTELAALGVGGRVWSHRLRPVDPAMLPCLLVYVVREQVDAVSGPRPLRLRRLVDLLVVVRDKGPTGGDGWPGDMPGDGVELRVDALGAKVETALGDFALAAVAKDFQLVGVEIAADPSADPTVLEAQMLYRAVIETRDGSPEIVA